MNEAVRMYGKMKCDDVANFDDLHIAENALLKMLEQHQDWEVGHRYIIPIEPHNHWEEWQLFVCEGRGVYRALNVGELVL